MMAGSLGALLAAPLGDRRALSVDAWLAAVAALLALSVVTNVMRTTPLTVRDLQPFWRRRDTEDRPEPSLPRSLTALEGTLLSSRDSRRAFTLRLQPRLIELADHYLATDHGLAPGPDSNDERLHGVLGDTAWMLDTTPSDRTPTLTEVERFLERLLVHRTESTQR